ncbi:hypothetical protein QFZ23_004325 [Arthrobacter globiformis]|uniref:hypothetical protein n=1 Tax=Arthrobacter globiformis TaxID=1665 RepID=UPI002783FB20|nr:hypothetical protein [Arthrobacter globiformis]MDQ1060424.1 hypothetical protein [Arthrobacter globiformis]
MSDSITASGSGGQQTARIIAVQPREIKEAAFRSLCAAGADPVEAQEGGLAVLRAEAEAHAGLRLLEELLNADWTTPTRPTAAKDSSWVGGTLRELDCTGQPALRTALQLLDLAADAPDGEMSVTRTAQARIPGLLWNDLVLRRTASLGRRIIIATTHGGEARDYEDTTNYLTVRNGALSATQSPASEAVTALIPQTTGHGTVVVVLPEPVHTHPETTNIPPKALKMREKEWQSMYQMSRKYLVPDA